ncbi:Nif3-like dinuclear metal center hexameric protein [Mesobacillus maritimus]|uniref:GTP cyclohydrolase 1 type 2 homolog n=1 Tax=Mesobacillus maritimus TaxID=1643336 RepID=A0ABS7K0F3_9BACI|nr:Nif3-like dinuclear metal center hexameric protein [Mesobacillus maritimus]
MNLEQFETSIKKLFTKELLKEFDDDYGFTNKTNDSIKRIGYSTNLSIEVIEQAKDNHVDLILTHHDAWDFIFGLKEACLEKLKEYNISHFWIHGPLDFIQFGTSTSLMRVIGVDQIMKHSIYDHREIPGIGEFSEPVDFKVLVQKMSTELGEPIRNWQNHNKLVKRVGVLKGAGHSSNQMKVALEDGCDTYITGEATLYTIQYAQFVGMNLLVGSHTFTEIYGVESLTKKLMEIHDDIEIIQLREEHFELNHG